MTWRERDCPSQQRSAKVKPTQLPHPRPYLLSESFLVSLVFGRFADGRPVAKLHDDVLGILGWRQRTAQNEASDWLIWALKFMSTAVTWASP